MSPARALRHLTLLVLAAVWILPLYLVLINATTDPDDYREKELYAPPSSFALWDNMKFAWDAVFVTCGIVFVIVGFASLGVDATRRLDAKPQAA